MATSAYAYLRVSGRSQVEGEGFPRQLAAVRHYAAAHDLRIAKIYREEGVSGKHELENRPALSELALATPAVVLIERLDRLARDLMVQETIVADLRRRGFTLISATEPADLFDNDPTRKMMRQIFGAIAEYDRVMMVARLKAAKDRIRARDGRCEGRKPYGFRKGEPAVLKAMHALRASGLGYDLIARTLNNDGYRTRKGTPWVAATVRRILLRGEGQKKSPGSL